MLLASKTIHPSFSIDCILWIMSIIHHFRYDSLIIYDGVSNSYPMIGKYCGDTIPPTQISKGNELLIHFQTDVSGREKGFQIDYTTSSKFY